MKNCKYDTINEAVEGNKISISSIKFTYVALRKP